ncbi:MAG: zinc ribbon domain-containing protein [Planctomycetes bacterium]|nr:zinc ribbon domain-containing protein [Planctomycetota bacterium]
MPTYAYRTTQEGERSGCERCRAPFEIVQSMKDAPLPSCPSCHGPVARVIGAPGICTSSTKSRVSDKNLKRHGFTKLVNEGGGKFRKI